LKKRLPESWFGIILQVAPEQQVQGPERAWWLQVRWQGSVPVRVH
jgi:hypothetical protein